jgi:MFS family permease
LLLGLGVLAAAAGPIGAGILVGFKTRDVLDMEPTAAGLLLAGGNIGAMLLSPLFGRLLDRYGARVCGVWSTTIVGAMVAGLGVTETVITTAALYAAAGSMFGFVIVVFQKLGASIVPENRGGALSAILSFRFVGHAIGPLLWVPVFERSVSLAFLGSALLGLVTIAAIVLVVPRRPVPVQAPRPQPPVRARVRRRSAAG